MKYLFTYDLRKGESKVNAIIKKQIEEPYQDDPILENLDAIIQIIENVKNRINQLNPEEFERNYDKIKKAMQEFADNNPVTLLPIHIDSAFLIESDLEFNDLLERITVQILNPLLGFFSDYIFVKIEDDNIFQKD